MARTYHTFDVIIIGSPSEGSAILKSLLLHTKNVMFIDASAQEPYNHAGEAAVLKALEKSGDKASFKTFIRKLRAIRQEADEKVDAAWKPIAHYRVTGKVNFESESAVRLNGKLLHAKAIILEAGSEVTLPVQKAHLLKGNPLPKGKWFTPSTLEKMRELPTDIHILGETPVANALKRFFTEQGVPMRDTLEGEGSTVIATASKPSAASFHVEKTRLSMGKDGLPVQDLENPKDTGAQSLFVVTADDIDGQMETILPLIIPKLS